MPFVLRYGPRLIELLPGRFLMGRAEDCQLPLDDPLVSRNHAAIDVTREGAVLRDLESRNGVRVNGTRVSGPQHLSLGDKIGIGGAELVFGETSDKSAQTLVQVPTQRYTGFGLLGALADKALGLGRGEEAEKLLGPQLEDLLQGVEAGRRYEVTTVERGCEYALKIAQATGNAVWLSLVFRFYRAMRRLPPTTLVDEICAVARKVKQPNLEELRRYLAVLRGESRDLGPSERFLLSRLEGLERSLG
ncbi:MAG TPA: FHA domain-containing protein [Polyangiaceae bacterium]|jgi:hypothetical protein|nr:FHA domain-containing protein [Polyangiaceae bacterium]